MIQVERFNNRFTPLNPAYLYARFVSLALTSPYDVLSRHRPTGRHAIRRGRCNTSLAQVGRRLLLHFLSESVGGDRMRTIRAAASALAVNL